MRISHYGAMVVVADFAQPIQPTSVFDRRIKAAA